MSKPKRLCSFVADDGTPCGRPHKAKGLCAGHYSQQLLGQPIRPLGEGWRSELLRPCGTPAAYTRGCRCDPCVAAYSEFQRRHRSNFTKPPCRIAGCDRPCVGARDVCDPCRQRGAAGTDRRVMPQIQYREFCATCLRKPRMSSTNLLCVACNGRLNRLTRPLGANDMPLVEAYRRGSTQTDVGRQFGFTDAHVRRVLNSYTRHTDTKIDGRQARRLASLMGGTPEYEALLDQLWPLPDPATLTK